MKEIKKNILTVLMLKNKRLKNEVAKYKAMANMLQEKYDRQLAEYMMAKDNGISHS